MEDFNVKTIIPAIIGLVLLFGGIIISKVGILGIENEYNQVSSVYADLQNEYEIKRSSQVAANELASTKYETINHVKERHTEDDKVLSDFMNSVFSWTDYASYNKTKVNIANTYVSDDNFMNIFFPNAEYKEEESSVENNEVNEAIPNATTEVADTTEATSTDATTSDKANKIDDNKLSMKFNGVESYLIDQTGNNFTYFARIAVISSSNGTDTNVVFTLKYTIDDEGNISNIQGVL